MASTFPPSICQEVMEPDAMIFAFSMLSLRQLFHCLPWPSSRGCLVPLCFLSLEWYHLNIWGYWYFTWHFDSSLWFIQPGILHGVLCIEVNEQGDYTQPWHSPFSILNQSSVPYSVLTLFLILIQVSHETGKVVWCSHLFENFPLCSDPHKGFSIVNEAEVDVFLEFPFFLYDLTDFGNLTSVSSAFSKSSLYIWKFLVHVHPINLVKLYFYFQFVSNIVKISLETFVFPLCYL